MTFNNKCKICKSNKAEEIEFIRFYLGWSYKTLIEFYENEVENINNYNLSNHLGQHTDCEKRKFWQDLRESEVIIKPTMEEQNVLFVKMKIGLGD